MKKILIPFVFLLLFISSVSYGQRSAFTPNLDATLRGGYSVWLSDASFKDYYKAFPSVQLDLAYNVSPQLAIYGTVGGDFVAPKERTFSNAGTTATESNTRVITAYIGPRYFFGAKTSKARFYADAGLGLYALKFGDYKETRTTNPPETIDYTYKSIAQFGFNIGTGVNVELSRSAFFNFNVKYHNVPKKSEVTLREKATSTTTVNGITTTTNLGTELLPVEMPGRSYIQFAIGFGYRLGL
jgi:outer membrane protein W